MANKEPTPEEILTLHRYFIWQNRMHNELDRVLADADARGVEVKHGTDEAIESFLFMSYWYAGLYVLIEGWLELGLHDAEVDWLLDSNNVALLKRYRNGVFHFQRTYYDARFLELIDDGDQVVEWVRALDNAFSRVLLEITPGG